jgi:hypothetical protein
MLFADGGRIVLRPTGGRDAAVQRMADGLNEELAQTRVDPPLATDPLPETSEDTTVPNPDQQRL